MGALSQQEIKKEFMFLNPESGAQSLAMRHVIANKVKSALCNPDAVQAERKAMFDDTYSYAKRSVHPESHPPDQRVKAYKRPTLDKKLQEKV